MMYANDDNLQNPVFDPSGICSKRCSLMTPAKLEENPVSTLLATRKLIVGAGGAAWWILEGFKRNNIEIEGFLVSESRWAKDSVCGLPVWHPENWNQLSGDKSEFVAILGIMNPQIDMARLEQDLKAHGWSNIISFSDFAKGLLSQSNINCGMLNPSELFSDLDSINKARKLLSDEKSIKIYDSTFEYVKLLDDQVLTEIDEDPYFPKDLPRLPAKLRMLDLGAFNGDTVKQAIAHDYELEAVICFEPDPKTFLSLVKGVDGEKNILCLPLGVSDKTEAKYFNNSGDTGNRVIDFGGERVQCISIDDLCAGFMPNFIKMDIEGSEFDALAGAKYTIEKSRPNLAISVYHTSKDIWRIPILIDSLLKGKAKYFLRRHSRTVADTVLYVFPKQN